MEVLRLPSYDEACLGVGEVRFSFGSRSRVLEMGNEADDGFLGM
jgi:hypothetical protein